MKRPAAMLAFTALCAAAADAPQDSWKTFDVKLEAHAMHEECMTVDANDPRRWQWKADGPVDFNVHYHKGNDVSYPVKRDGMRGDGGVFVARTREGYCWMWTARDKPVRLEGRIEAREAK
jgi:hypothetical protein